MLDEQYIEELAILIILGFILCLSKLFSCCYSLGLYQKHKEVKLRRDSLSQAKIDCLQAEIFGQDQSVLTNIVCTCGNSQPPVFPKVEPCSPVSNITQIPVKHLVTVHFKETEKAPTHAD